MKKITYFDVEYANRINRSICHIGVICENFETADPVYPDKDMFLNPEDMFEAECIALHGIDAKRVHNAQNFKEAWSGLEKYFTSAIVVGHEAQKDLNALATALNRYHLDVPALYYICTKELAQKYIPAGEVTDYSLTGLCKHFGIKMLTEYYAYDDALGNAALFRKLIKTYGLNVDELVKKYEPPKDMLQVSLSRFYGMLQGFAGDGTLAKREHSYILAWRDDHKEYAENKQISAVLAAIENLPAENVSAEELAKLTKCVKDAMLFFSSSAITSSTHILEGLLNGLATDGKLNMDECRTMHNWMVENIYLTGNYIFDKLLALIDEVISVGSISQEKSDEIVAVIKKSL